MTTWILLRGLGREARHWGDFPLALQEMLAARVVTLDLPGNGHRHAEVSPATVQSMADGLRGTLRRLDVPPPYGLFALSLGGMVAVSWATRYPSELSAAVLVNTSMRGFGRWYQRLRPRNYLRLAAMLGTADADAFERAVLRMTTRHRVLATDAILSRWAAWRRSHPVSVGNVVRQLRAAATFQAPPEPPAVPVLVLAAAGDTLVNSACSIRMAHAWNACLAIHPTAGHDLPLDDPQWVLLEVAGWLERTLRVETKRHASAGSAD